MRDICLVIPDATTRVMLLDMETLPEKPQDADAVVRFRLKKSLPFDVDQSSVSFDRQGTANPMRVIAAVTPRTVLEEYESLVREAGYNPGSVVPSMLAALGVVDASRPTMVIKVEHGTTTFAIVDHNQLLQMCIRDSAAGRREERQPRGSLGPLHCVSAFGGEFP